MFLPRKLDELVGHRLVPGLWFQSCVVFLAMMIPTDYDWIGNSGGNHVTTNGFNRTCGEEFLFEPHFFHEICQVVVGQIFRSPCLKFQPIRLGATHGRDMKGPLIPGAIPISIHFCIRRVILGSQWLRGKDCTALMTDYEKVAKERRKQILQLQDWKTVPGGLMD